jgi:hypothetical protein
MPPASLDHGVESSVDCGIRIANSKSLEVQRLEEKQIEVRGRLL